MKAFDASNFVFNPIREESLELIVGHVHRVSDDNECLAGGIPGTRGINNSKVFFGLGEGTDSFL